MEKNKLSQTAEKIYEILKGSENGLTVADLKEMGINANSSHLVALKKRGLIDSEDTIIEVQTVVKRKVQLYKVIDKK